MVSPFSCHLSFFLLTLYSLSHSTTFFCLILVSTNKLDPLELVGGSYCPRKISLYGKWCVEGLSVLSHMHTPPGSTFILTWVGGEDTMIPFFPSSHAQSVVFLLTRRFWSFSSRRHMMTSSSSSPIFCVCVVSLHVMGLGM